MEKYKKFAQQLWEERFEENMKDLKKTINKSDLCYFVIDEITIKPIKQVILCLNNEFSEVYYLCQGLPEMTDQAYGKTVKTIALKNLDNQQKQEIVLSWLFS